MDDQPTTAASSARTAEAVAKPPRVGFSPRRVGLIAFNTLVEAVRRKVFNILLVIALLFIASAGFFSQFTFSEQLKFVKDLCLGAISVLGTLIAIIVTAQMLPTERENRTLSTVLAKPVRRSEFLLGKFFGALGVIFISAALMSALLAVALVAKERGLLNEVRSGRVQYDSPEATQEAIASIRAEARDPDVAKAVILIFMKLALVAAITLFLSTFSTSVVFTIVTMAMIFFAGHLRGAAAEMWSEHRILVALLAAVPDLQAFNVADEIVLGHAIPWSHVGKVLAVGLARIAIFLVAAHLIFSEKDAES
jgi:ABC-type Na+ efflux pump permease subunit